MDSDSQDNRGRLPLDGTILVDAAAMMPDSTGSQSSSLSEDDSSEDNHTRRMEEGLEDDDDPDFAMGGGLMADESLYTVAGDEFLRPRGSTARRVLFTLDDSQNDEDADDSEPRFSGAQFDVMKKRMVDEEGEDYSESSTSFKDDYNFIRRTLDYEEDFSDSEIEDDPSVIEEAERVETEIRKGVGWVALTVIGMKIFNKLMDCLMGEGDIQQEVTAHVVDDLTNSINGSSGGILGVGGQGGGAAAQAQ